MKKNYLLLTLPFLVFLTLIPRAIELINGNYIFLFDQGREYLAAKGIVVSHKFILIGTELGAGSAGISGIFHGPMYYYLLTIPFVLFNGNPYGAIWLMFLFSVLAIIAGYFLGKKIWGTPWGIFVAFLFAASPPFISQARFMWSPNPPTVFIVLAFFFVYQYLQTRKTWAIFWAAFFSGFVYNFEFALAVPMVLTLIVYSLLLRQKGIRYYAAMFGGVIVAFLPMILFEVRHHFLAVHGVVSYLSHKTTGKVHQSFFDNVAGHWTAFFNNVADTFPQHAYIPGIILLVALLLFGCWYLFREKNENMKYFFIYLLLLLPINVVVFGFLRNTVYHYYLTDLNVVYIFLFTYIVYSSWHKKERIVLLIISMYSALLLYGAITNAVQTWFHDIHDYGGTSKIKGIEQAIDYIYKDAGDKKFGVLVFAPPVYTYQYDYMLWWYGDRKYHYIPYGQKKGLVYLLIEKDPAKPWSYKGWLETVIKTGKVLQTTTLSPSGFIIQKREFN